MDLGDFDFVGEAKKIVAMAQEAGVTLRVLGATAFRIHCPDYVETHIKMERILTDVDFVALTKEERELEEFLASKLGMELEKQRAALTPGLFVGRHIYVDQKTGLHVDVFFDELNMCHVVPFKGRLQVDTPTIPLAELVLEKMQIITLNEKDVKDVIMVFAAHPVGDHDSETINGKYISQLLANDWGFYYTTTLNLDKVRNGLERYKHLFSAEDSKNVEDRLAQLRQMMDAAPKSIKWKARAAIGPRVQWYNDVEEVDRADHLADL